MPLYLHTIKPSADSKKKKRRIGRGGKRGTYSGRGMKGQKARSGGRGGLKRRGMRQLMERTHKLRGFKSIRPKSQVVYLYDLNKFFKDGETVTPQALLRKKLIVNLKNTVKVLSNGELKIKLTLSNLSLSKAARAAVEKAGGRIIERPKDKAKNQAAPKPAGE